MLDINFWSNGSLVLSRVLALLNKRIKCDSRVFSDQPINCALLNRSSRIANAFDDAGLGHNEVIASIIGNGFDSQALFWATTSYGATYQIINPDIPAELIAREINSKGARLIFVDRVHAALFNYIQPLLLHVENVVIINGHDDKLLFGLSLDDFIDGCDDEYRWVNFSEQTTALIGYELGRQGTLYCHHYTHRQVLIAALATCMADATKISADDNVFWDLSLYFYRSWAVPVATLILGVNLELFEPSKVTLLDGLLKSKASVCFISLEYFPELWNIIQSSSRLQQQISRVYVLGIEQKCYIEKFYKLANIELVTDWIDLIPEEHIFDDETGATTTDRKSLDISHPSANHRLI